MSDGSLLERLDSERMSQALALACGAIGITEPNPRVGCVIGTHSGQILGTGATQKPGQAHAEVMALRSAAAAGHKVEGATAWVTLEPCAHFGRTPPCCDALIAAGLARVVIAVEDPFPQVAGQGIERLRAAGVQVDHCAPAEAEKAFDLNVGFFSRVLRARPWIRLKVATSLDGRTALPDGTSQWITGERSRTDAHAWRKRSSALLTGVGTVLADDPLLNVRLVPSNWQPLRVIADSTLRTPPSAKLFTVPGPVLIAGTHASPQRAAALLDRGAEVSIFHNQSAAVDLIALVTDLAQRGVNELHVEAGPRLNAALIQAGLVDELLIYMAPVLIGPGSGVVDWPALQSLSIASRFRSVEARQMGDDLRLRLLSTAHGSAERRKFCTNPSEFFTGRSPPE